jgi:hypothetical protein
MSQNTNINSTNSENSTTTTLNPTNVNKTDTNSSNTQNTSNNQQNTNISASNSSLPQSFTSTKDLIPISNESLLGKWLITSQANPNFDFTALDYFLLILPTRIILYGGCNVFYTSYEFN